MSKELKVKEIAKQYGVSAKEIIEELAGQGIETPQAENSVIPDDMVELVEAYFADLFEQEAEAPVDKKTVKKGPKKASSTKKEEPGRGSKNRPQPQKPSTTSSAPAASSAVVDGKLTLPAPIIVKTLAEAVGKKPNELITDLIKLGELAGINQPISEANAKKLCRNYGIELVIGQPPKPAAPAAAPKPKPEDNPAFLKERPPVVTFMGHVDHGKTSLQDAIRHTHVTDKEAGAITQHIGASTVSYKGKGITFIDTPGHAAFTNMRARGANATDLVVLVVAATEGFKPQTVEAMNQALAAKVPIIVAINKIDLPDADPDKVLLHMQQHGLTSENWGGTVGTVPVSAKTGQGLPDLLERILMEAEMLELKANPKRAAQGIVLEAQLENGLGPTASVLIQDGTLHVGDVVLCGESYGKIRTLINDKNERVKSAGPSTPVKIVGLSGVPDAGDPLEIFESEKAARAEAANRVAEKRGHMLATSSIATAEDLFSKLNSEDRNTLNIIIKSDVRGSGEAITQSLAQLPSEKIKAEVISCAVGPISENDISLAAATNSLVVGFHVRVNPGVNDMAKKQNVEIRLYSIIYELLEDITDALAGKLEPEKREKPIGTAKILQVIELSKGPKICGCMVESGSVHVGAKARVRRSKELIYNGEVASLRRFKDDVKEVKAGLECGIRLDNFNDFIEGDEIELYDIELKKATL
ncbi:translation initiation factor IF-2 [Victivallis vadensis]|uniref:Translation initiation factor IF-2 n=1 Tax=Victivallis vadensis TaxID=172901 RepID=A0A2U1BBJ7_9BACT|nr:translation initiation factor IF-2 [Victivallis vadensis]PVY45947.1 translation initiation factor IF-2 [Victivallis vadensis]